MWCPQAPDCFSAHLERFPRTSALQQTNRETVLVFRSLGVPRYPSPCRSLLGWNAVCPFMFTILKSWDLHFSIIQNPNTEVVFSTVSAYWWEQPRSLPFYTTSDGSEIWKPGCCFLLSQNLTVQPKGKHYLSTSVTLKETGGTITSSPHWIMVMYLVRHSTSRAA